MGFIGFKSVRSGLLIVTLACLTVLSACGGKGQISLEGKGEASAPCDPVSGSAGTEVTCDLPKGVDDSCTLFFRDDSNHEIPVKADFSDISFSFKVPHLTGNQDLIFRCGDQDEIPVGSFAIRSENAQAHATDGTTTGHGDEEITPSGAGAGSGKTVGAGTAGETTAGETPPADSGSDAATPTAPSALTATIKATKMFDTRLGLVRIDWTVAGGDDLSELYIYSGGFYRTSSDFSMREPCSEIEGDTYSSNGKRLLLVNSNGDDLNEGSDIYEQWSSYLATAQYCADGVCDGYTPPQGRIISGVPVCRMDLKDSKGAAVRSGTFYTRVLEEDKDFHLYAKTSSGEETSATTPAVTIDPVDLSVNLKVGSDNRVQVSATVKGALRSLSIQTQASAVPNVINGITNSVPGFNNVVGASQAQATTVPTAINNIANAMPGFNNVVAASSTCTSNSDVLQKNGDESYVGTCPFRDQQTLVLTAHGIGTKNVVSKIYKINIENVKKVELKDAGDHNCKGGMGSFGWSECEGTLNLAVHVSPADYTIKDQDGKIADSGDTYAGLGEVELYSKPKDDKKTLIRSKALDEDGNVTFTEISRNHDHYIWQAKVGSVESNTTEKIDGLEPYKSSFSLDKQSWDDKFVSAQKGVVCKAGGELTGNITWHAEHLKDIDYRCVGKIHLDTPGGGAGSDGSRDYTDDSCAQLNSFHKGSYEQQHGEVKMKADIYNVGNSWKHTCDCDFTATAYDNTKYTQHASWEYECSVH